MRISVVLSTFNGAPWLAAQLRSVAGQTRVPDELVVFDDASSDQTLAMLRAFAAAAPFPVTVERQPVNVGSTANFGLAIARAGGDVIALCDQDDVWYPQKLGTIERAFAGDDSIDLVFGDADVIDGQSRPAGYTLWQSVNFGPRVRQRAHQNGLVSILARYNVATGTTMAFRSRRRDLLLPIADGWVHDGWIAILLAAAGKVVWIDEPLLAYRTHVRQQIGAARNTLGRQFDTARRMDAEYFSRLAQNFQDLIKRLQSTSLTVDPRVLALLRQKIDHCHARIRMRTERGSKLRLMAGELFSGRYISVAWGWKSVAQDLLLSRQPEPSPTP